MAITFEKDEIHFHNFLESIREYRGVTTEQLCAGLCSVSQMHYIQNGERLPDYLMRNRIMARLGISSEGYEDYVHYDEYDRWCERQKLIAYIEDSKWEEAKLLLSDIGEKWEKKSRIEQQFILDIKARILINECASYEELCAIYEKIVNLTVKEFFNKKKRQIYLSHVEFYYVLNYLYYKYKKNVDNRREVKEELESIINTILSSPLEGIARAKVLPFAVVIYYEVVRESSFSLEKIYNYSTEAIDVLKETERSYYLKELVSVRNELIINSNREQNIDIEKQVVSIIGDIENKFFVNIPMWQNGYIYRDSQVSCIADVIRARRKMMKIPRIELAEGICSERTLERIEAKHSKPQQYVMKALFGRLNLVGDYRRAEIITSDIELINRFNKYKEKVNQKLYNEALEEADYVIAKLDNRYISNKQTAIRLKSISDYFAQKIDRQELILNLENALKLTVDIEDINTAHCYLTNGELVLLHNIALQRKEENYQRVLFDNYFLSMNEYAFYSFFSIYELVKDWEASSLGNNGFFDESNKISLSIIVTSLRLCKIHGLYRALSNVAWNKFEKNKTENSIATYNNLLKQCITLCDFSSNKLAEVFGKELKEQLYFTIKTRC